MGCSPLNACKSEMRKMVRKSSTELSFHKSLKETKMFEKCCPHSETFDSLAKYRRNSGQSLGVKRIGFIFGKTELN